MMRFASFVFVAGCLASGGSSGSNESSTEGPLVGVDGSLDQADRSCNVVLRDLERPSASAGYQTHGSNWIWTGSIEISSAAAAEGLVPAALYRSGSDLTWHEVTSTGSTAAATTGYKRYDLVLDGSSLPGPGMSGSAIANSKIQVVPFIHLGGGGRLFDHNRNLGELDNYAMTAPDLAVSKDPTVCAPPTGPTSANLVFAADYTQHRDGVLSPGGQLTLSYAKSRLATCASTQGGIPQYGITAWVKFLPGNQLTTLDVLDQTPTIAVPSDARRVLVWFETSDVHGCHAYDSNNGANYAFDAAVAPQWIGNGTSLFSRDTTYKCNTPGAAPITSGFSFDTWTRERAAITNTCFEVYQPGLTDVDDPDLWQKLDVEIHVQTAPQTWTAFPVNFESRQGNNARYAFSWRQADPFRDYYCTAMPVTPTSDGQYEAVQLGYYITVNGSAYRPEPGASFAATFVNYLHATDAFCPH
ncbi:hypothetical protein BH11MYX1_BH11MYX1_17830 [soil metagenome]